MTGPKIASLLLAGALITGGNQFQKSLSHFVDTNPRAMYLLAQYKLAKGDTDSALRLLKRSSAAASTKVAETKSHRHECPYSTI